MSIVIQFEDILFFFLSAIPEVYLANFKYFIYTNNSKFNLFILRLFITVPATLPFIAVFSFILAVLFSYLFPEFFISLNTIMNGSVKCVFSLILSLLFILFFKRFILASDMPEKMWRTPDASPLYLYFPQRIRWEFVKKFQTVSFRQNEIKVKVEKLVGDLAIYEDDFQGNCIGLTRHGFLVVTEDALTVLKNNQISCFTECPVNKHRDELINKYASDKKYFRLILTNEMPPAVPPTDIDYDNSSSWTALVDLKLYYPKSILEQVCDLNYTYEYFGNTLGTPSYVSQYVIVTQKMKDIFIHQLGQSEWDFRMVYLVDDDGNIAPTDQ